MRENSLFYKSKSRHEVAISALLNVENVACDDVVIVQEGRCAVHGRDLRELIKVAIANNHYTLLQLAQNLVIEVRIVLLLKYLPDFPHFFIAAFSCC